MIIALRITTGGLGCRAYVEGYCGRATLVLSGVALAAAGAGATSACPGRVPPPPPADAHAPVSASAVPTHAKPSLPGREPGTGFRRLGVNSWNGTSSKGHNDRMLGPPSPGLLDELDDEWLPHELRFEQTSRRICADVHRKRHPGAGHVDTEPLERAGRDGDGLRRAHLEREHLDGVLARREEGHRERLAGGER